jgi:ABC-type transport system involved in Fe-S cluster assembly, permease and ATPase components
VFVALVFLIAAKLAAVTLPLVLKHLVDDLGGKAEMIAIPLGLLLAYGALRFVNVLAGELRDIVFGRVTERAMRRSAIGVFRHLHGLDLDFHLSRRTGELARDIERGIEGIRFLLRFSLFNIVPTLFEILMVAAILWGRYNLAFALISLGAVVLYIGFSVWVTEWRSQYVRAQNQLDSSASARALDALLNYETVKYFGNEGLEEQRYDRSLAEWERAAIRNRLSLATLNIGQALIIAGALTAMMWLAADEVVLGHMTVGDFVAVNAYMIQLFIPLNVLGFVYREVRRAMIDMQRMFGLLDARPRVADRENAGTLQVARAELRFENVVFGYGPGRRILHGVDFTVPAGRKVAVVGASGAGKSTLARLLFRFYDPEQGACASTVRICARSARPRCASRSASCRRTPCCSTTASATTSPTVGPTPPTPRSRTRHAAPTSPTSSPVCRRAMTPRSASAA